MHQGQKTSAFTRDATEFVDRIEGMKVVLIDGATLVELMLDHDVGVTRTKVYELKNPQGDCVSLVIPPRRRGEDISATR